MLNRCRFGRRSCAVEVNGVCNESIACSSAEGSKDFLRGEGFDMIGSALREVRELVSWTDAGPLCWWDVVFSIVLRR